MQYQDNYNFNAKDKYKLTTIENIFLAKKNLISSIYSGAKIEGINVTFPETDAIVNGINVPRLNIDEIDTIRALRDAWKYTINNIELPFSLDFACKINEIVARNDALYPGAVRTGNVFIGGTSWMPPAPDKKALEQDLAKILSTGSATDKALNYFQYGCINQLFWDGNKRTSFICANKILIDNGAGLLHIKDKDFVKYNELLSRFYESAAVDGLDGGPLKRFLYGNCIEGMEMNPVQAQVQDDNEMG